MALTDKLSAIGNAIRAKTGGTDMLTLDQMPNAIAGIQTSNDDLAKKMITGEGTITELPSDITKIGKYAFYNCVELELTSLPSGITSIGRYAFYGCSNLALTSLPSNITTIPAFSFNDCQKMKLTYIPSSVTEIGSYAFQDCYGLRTLTFEGTPTRIDSMAFSGCINLTTINVPWAEGTVANAPWSATRATINYNYTE